MIALYARISTEEQSKYSISDQLRQCRLKAKSKDVKEYVDEGFSGEFLDRPALQQLRQDIREGLITKVICLDPDRLSRKLMNQLIVSEEIERRAELVFVNGEYAKTPEGMLFYQMRGAVAEFEKAKINERMSRGRREKARQGKVVRDFQIYGYGYDKETASYFIIEEEAKVVKLIFDLFTQQRDDIKGINGIAHYLTKNDVPTKRGGKVWHKQVVRQILMNHTYTGTFYQNRWNTEGMMGNKHRKDDEKIPLRERPKEEWIPVKCPVIIDESKFEHAQKLLSEARRRYTNEGNHKYLLSGLLRCGECGNTMTGRKAKNWETYVYEYTDIKNTAGAKFKGCGLKIRCDKLDDYVWEKVYQMLNHPEQVAAASEQPKESFEENEISRIEKRLDSIKQGRKRLLKLFASGIQDIGEEDIREELRQLKEEEDNLTEKLEEMKYHISSQKGNEFSTQLLMDLSKKFMGNLENADFETKQQLIRQLFREIRLFKDGTVESYSL